MHRKPMHALDLSSLSLRLVMIPIGFCEALQAEQTWPGLVVCSRIRVHAAGGT